MFRRMMVVLTLTASILILSGCSTYYSQRYPVLEKPVKPKLENISGTEMKKMSAEAQKAVANNFNKLIDYSGKLEIAVDTYNIFAEKKNAEILTDPPDE